MILTLVFVERNAVNVAVKLKKMCVNVNKGRGYVVVYWSKIIRVYCEYEHDVRYNGTVVRFSLPSCLLIGKMEVKIETV